MKKVAFIVGASSGIGLRLGANLLDEGFTVVNASRTKCKLNNVENIKTDATIYGSITSAVEKTAKKYGGIDVAVYCAGESIAGGVEETPIEKAKRLFDVNYWGAVEMSQAVAPIMRGCSIENAVKSEPKPSKPLSLKGKLKNSKLKASSTEIATDADTFTPLEKASVSQDKDTIDAQTKQAPCARGGKILFIGSMAGRVPLPYEAFYSSSKSALAMLAKNLNIELKKFKIQVGCLCPGGTATPFTEKRTVIKKENSPYSDSVDSAVRTISEIETDGANANAVASKICTAILAQNTPIESPLGFSNHLTSYAIRLMPVRLSNWLVGSLFS